MCNSSEKSIVLIFFLDDDDCPACEEALKSLEDIDDDIDELDIIFVKIQDARYAFRYGVKNLPALTYFRKRFPTIYHGEFHSFLILTSLFSFCFINKINYT